MKKHLMLGVKTSAAIIASIVLGVILGVFVSWELGLVVGIVLAGLSFVIGGWLIAKNMARIMKDPGSMLDEAAPAFDSMGKAADRFFENTRGPRNQRGFPTPPPVPTPPPFPPSSRYGSYGLPPDVSPKDYFGNK